MDSKHTVGLHVRIQSDLLQLAQEAIDLNLKILQFFLTKHQSSHYWRLTAKDKDEFKQLSGQHFSHVFIHSSYWINPASGDKKTAAVSKYLLKREIALAKTLGIRHLVLHAGSAKGHLSCTDSTQSKQLGILAIARMLNTILKREDDIMILLENSAHGNRTVGSDLKDFLLLRQELHYPEKIGFCFDTAHAFSYGYDLHDSNALVQLIDTHMGLENVKLIHFNDIEDEQGSMLDRHAFPGRGKIGKDTLAAILNHPRLAAIPKIIEGPSISKTATIELLAEINTWLK